MFSSRKLKPQDVYAGIRNPETAETAETVETVDQLFDWITNWMILVDGNTLEVETQQATLERFIKSIKSIVDKHISEPRGFFARDSATQIASLVNIFETLTGLDKVVHEHEEIQARLTAIEAELSTQDRSEVGDVEQAAIEQEEIAIKRLEQELQQRRDKLAQRKKAASSAVIGASASTTSSLVSAAPTEITALKKEQKELLARKTQMVEKRVKMLKVIPSTFAQWKIILEGTIKQFPDETHATRIALEGLSKQLLAFMDKMELKFLAAPLLTTIVNKKNDAERAALERIEALAQQVSTNSAMSGGGSLYSVATAATVSNHPEIQYAFQRVSMQEYWSNARIMLIELLAAEIALQEGKKKLRLPINGNTLMLVSQQTCTEDQIILQMQQYAGLLIDETKQPDNIVETLLEKHPKLTITGKVSQSVGQKGVERCRSLKLEEKDPQLGLTENIRMNKKALSDKLVRLSHILNNQNGLMYYPTFAAFYREKAADLKKTTTTTANATARK